MFTGVAVNSHFDLTSHAELWAEGTEPDFPRRNSTLRVCFQCFSTVRDLSFSFNLRINFTMTSYPLEVMKTPISAYVLMNKAKNAERNAFFFSLLSLISPRSINPFLMKNNNQRLSLNVIAIQAEVEQQILFIIFLKN